MRIKQSYLVCFIKSPDHPEGAFSLHDAGVLQLRCGQPGIINVTQ
jgi:hypothetical protein